MEEIPDKDAPKAGNILHEGTKAIMMTEEKYWNDVKKRGGVTSRKAKSNSWKGSNSKNTPKSKATMTETTTATKNMTVPDISEQQPRVNQETIQLSALKPRKILQFTETNMQYCEPTSSKVKVEELITAEHELAQHEHQQPNQNSDTELGT